MKWIANTLDKGILYEQKKNPLHKETGSWEVYRGFLVCLFQTVTPLEDGTADDNDITQEA